MKPFAEVSIVQRINEHSSVQQYKYFKVLIQEFHVKVDIGFINALVKMFEANATSDDEEVRSHVYLVSNICDLYDKRLLNIIKRCKLKYTMKLKSPVLIANIKNFKRTSCPSIQECQSEKVSIFRMLALRQPVKHIAYCINQQICTFS